MQELDKLQARAQAKLQGRDICLHLYSMCVLGYTDGIGCLVYKPVLNSRVLYTILLLTEP